MLLLSQSNRLYCNLLITNMQCGRYQIQLNISIIMYAVQMSEVEMIGMMIHEI